MAGASPLMSAAEQTHATRQRGAALANRARLVLGPKIRISGAGARGLNRETAETIQSESLETHNARTTFAKGRQLARISNSQIGPSHISRRAAPWRVHYCDETGGQRTRSINRSRQLRHEAIRQAAAPGMRSARRGLCRLFNSSGCSSVAVANG